MKFDYDAAASLYRSGLTLREVGQHYGVTHEAIRLALIQCGVPLRPRGSGRPRRGKPLPASQIAAEYASGTTLVALLGKYRAGDARVKEAIVSQGVRLRTFSEVGTLTSRLRDLPEGDIEARYLAGEHAPRLAYEYGVTTPTIVKRLRKRGVAIRGRFGRGLAHA